MKKIYLFCIAGMSTSMLAKNMQKAADDHKLPFDVQAFSFSALNETVETEKPDCILLGPQMAYSLDATKEKFGDERAVIAIDPDDYGALDGERVLKAAIIAMKKFKEAHTQN